MPALLVVYLFLASANCSEGGDCPGWLATPAARALFVMSLALVAIGILYALAERVLTGTARQQRFVIGLVVLFVAIVFILPALIFGVLSRR